MADKERDYIQSIFKNDHFLIREIYDKYFGPISNFVTTNSGTIDDSKDIFQEALLIIFQKRHQENFKLTSSFHTFLYAVCKNLWRQRMSKNSILSVDIDIVDAEKDQDEVASDVVRESHRYELYREKLVSLDEKCRKIMQLFFNKTKMTEIVEIMGYSSVGMAKKKKFQCKERLVKMITEDSQYQQLMHNEY